ncbi:hypothetical protein LIN78_04675 [Leeia sp. TBRC 13508]|uniref:DUF3800 domain-containing protein n=1 Tax=Leeia speluncae TaxID=2884804 RepID=A0ABS8D3S5_9NEIS|nr:hypothetical protein [Leeia speluncae]MCB6182843.1 hypothetical protein [Leeia speluncae]
MTIKNLFPEDMACYVFGDESTASNDRFAIYSMIGGSQQTIRKTLLILQEYKMKYGIDSQEKLHCRVIFSKHQREKTSWGKLTDKQVLEFFRNLSEALLPVGLLWSYGYIDMREVLNNPKPEKMAGKFSTENGKEFSFDFKVKQAQQFAYSAAEIHFIQRYGTRFKIWCDQDKTKIEWFEGKKQPHNINRHIGVKGEVNPPRELEPMLEIADLFAYTTSRHLSAIQSFGEHVFRNIHKKFNPKASKMNLDPSLFGGDIPTKEWLKSS